MKPEIEFPTSGHRSDTPRRAGDGIGVARAMRGAELSLLDAAVKSPGSLAAHPFVWAPFAVIGEDGAAAARSSWSR